VDFRILGPLEVVDQHRPVTLGKGKQRALLGVLLLHPNEVVSADRLIDELWGEQPPATALTALQGYVSQLRKLMGAERLETVPPGYRLRVAADELDAARFEQLAGEGRHDEALALWRGPALADLAYEPFAQGEIVRLEELRLASIEGRIASELASGRHGELVGELEALVQQHPLRERFRAQLMLALYGSGRQAEALEAFQSARATLVEELGIEPSEELKELQKRILAHDPELAVASPSAAAEPFPAAVEEPAPEPPRKVRKTVTILFCDLVEWTALGSQVDPEVLEDLLRRYHEAAAGVVARHGGTIEKFIGDAVMAVFGLPRVHEDDALRALRAATEIPAAIESLGTSPFDLRVRIGINTGEVVAGGEPMVAGDAVNVAARLEQGAQAGEILLGETTWRLVREVARAEPLEIAVKGKSRPLRAWRLDELAEPTQARHFDTALIGRERELRRLREALEETVERRIAHLFTLLGVAGIGKTRLAHEFVAGLGTRARVLTGRCLPYGDGITYWPLVEIGRELGQDAVRTALEAERDAELLTAHAAGALGLEDVPTSKDEIFVAVRKLFEALARERPLVVVFEDIHWAEPTLLDLIEEIAEISRDCALLILCLARPDLLEDRAAWGGGKLNATSLLIDPLSEGESDLLIDRLLGAAPLEPDARRRIAEAAEGIPLFVEQMLALVGAAGQHDGDLSVPPTIQAVLAARLDRLGPGERSVIEAAAVVGKEFWAEAVGELLPHEARDVLPRHLAGLVRKELVRPHRSPFFGPDGYRFRHILIQDASYRSIPKLRRAELHERFGAWLERRGDTVDYLEIVGYHYEQAALYRAELDPADPEAPRLAGTAADLLGGAGVRAVMRDSIGAEKLIERAVALVSADDPKHARLLLELGYVTRKTASFERSETALRQAAASSRASGDRQTEALASLLLATDRLSVVGDANALEELRKAAEHAAEVSEGGHDKRWLAIALKYVGFVRLLSMRFAEAEEPLQRALEAAREARSAAEVDNIVEHLTYLLRNDPTPLSEAISRLEHLRTITPGGTATPSTSMLYAMLGRTEEARRVARDAVADSEESGSTIVVARNIMHLAEVEEMAGDLAAAEEAALEAHAFAEAAGHKYVLAATSSLLARLLAAQGRDEEALRFAELSEHHGGGRPGPSQLDRRLIRAVVLARRGEFRAAERLAREVLDVVRPESAPVARAELLIWYAEILELDGRVEAAKDALAEALILAERKENVVTAERARGALDALAARITPPRSAGRAARR
jgi:predicted ATPase/class 3 adenylate cyclase/DNA-binding winged helix-turn-helix (wHTH) protein